MDGSGRHARGDYDHQASGDDDHQASGDDDNDASHGGSPSFHPSFMASPYLATKGEGRGREGPLTFGADVKRISKLGSKSPFWSSRVTDWIIFKLKGPNHLNLSAVFLASLSRIWRMKTGEGT